MSPVFRCIVPKCFGSPDSVIDRNENGTAGNVIHCIPFLRIQSIGLLAFNFLLPWPTINGSGHVPEGREYFTSMVASKILNFRPSVIQLSEDQDLIPHFLLKIVFKEVYDATV